MPNEVSYKLGMTLKLSKNSQFEFFRPEIEFKVDPAGDVSAQLEESAKALHLVMEQVHKEMNEQIIGKMPDVDAEMQLQVNKRFQELQRQIDALKGNISPPISKRKIT